MSFRSGFAFATAFHLLFQFCQYAKITQGCLFNFTLYVLNGFLCLVCFYPCFFAGNILLFVPYLFPDTGVGKNDAFFIAIEFNHHELGCFVSLDLLAVFLVEVAVRCKSFQAVRELNDSALVVLTGNSSFVNGSDCKGILQRISRDLLPVVCVPVAACGCPCRYQGS